MPSIRSSEGRISDLGSVDFFFLPLVPKLHLGTQLLLKLRFALPPIAFTPR
jgi:hypothetical protein